MRTEAPSDPPIQVAGSARGPVAHTDEGRGPAVVLVHGVPGSVRDFRWLAPALVAAGLRVVRVELPGFGRTPADGWDQSIEARAVAVETVIAAAGLERFTVVGHSMGGATAAAVAARAGSRCDGLALLASFGTRPHRGALPPAQARVLLTGLGVPVLGPRMWRRVVAAYHQRGFPRSTPEQAMRVGIEVALHTSWTAHRANLRAVQAPILVAWTDDDRLVEPAVSRDLARFCGAETVHWPTGGHNLQKTRSVELAARLAGFVTAGRRR